MGIFDFLKPQQQNGIEQDAAVELLEITPGQAFQEVAGPQSYSNVDREKAECLRECLEVHELLEQVISTYRAGINDTYAPQENGWISPFEGAGRELVGTLEDALHNFRVSVLRDHLKNPALDSVGSDLREAFRSASEMLRIIEDRELMGTAEHLFNFSYGYSNSNPAIAAKAQANFEILIAGICSDEELLH